MNRPSARLLPSFARKVVSTASFHPRHHFRHCGLALALFTLAAAGLQAQNTFAPEPVGTTSAAQNVMVTSFSGGIVSSVEVLTGGDLNGDFAGVAGSSNCLGFTLSKGRTCTESVTFTPSAPGMRRGAVVLLDSGNNVLGTTYISGTGQGGLGVLAPGNLLPFAGNYPNYSSVDDNHPATAADLYLPASVTMDGAGNVYIADSLHNRVRMVCGAAHVATIAGTTCTTTGIISTVAGNGNSTFSGDGGPANLAAINQPNGVTIDGAGNLYIADTGNNRVRMVSAATGNISTVAGTGQVGDSNNNQVGDGGPATSANLNQPTGVTVDGSDNLYIADTNNHRIREVTAASGVISTVAGTGSIATNGDGGYSGDGGPAISAQLNYPYAVAFDAAGNMYIPDSQNNRIREVAAIGGIITSASPISTYAGSRNAGYSGDGGQATAAELHLPKSVAFDPAGNLYIADTQNNAIRKVIAPSSGRADQGFISTIVQNGIGEYLFNGKPVSIALYGPTGLYFDAQGDLFVADFFDMVVRELQSNAALADFSQNPVRQGYTSSTKLQPVENDGNAPLDLGTIVASTNGQIDTTVTNSCPAGSTMPADSDCVIGAVFAPASTPTLTSNQPETATITASEDTQPSIPAPNNPLNIDIMGVAEPVNATTTVVSSVPNPSKFGQNVAFTVTVTTGAGTGDLTGTVSISDTYNGTTKVLTGTPLQLVLGGNGTTGTASFSISTLGVGDHSIVASYSGDTGHFKSSSTDNGVTPLIQHVQEETAILLTSSQNPSAVGQSVKFQVTVSSTGGSVVPSGTVQFMDGTNPLGAPVALTASGTNGVASYTTSTLANGPHTITAVYSGDPTDEIQAGTSNAVVQDVQAAATLGVTSSLNPSYYGNAVTFTATVTSTATTPASGVVSFLDNGVQIGAGTLAGNPAMATFTTSTLAVGTHPITARYAGDAYNSAANAAAPISQVVNQAETKTAVMAAPAPGIAGAPETITATVTVTAGTVTPGGTVTFTSGGATLGSVALNGSGTVTIKPALAPGNYQIVATYSGNTQAAGSASTPFALTVVQATTQTALAITPNPGVVTRPITFTARVTGNGGTPTGNVNFTVNGSALGAVPLNASGVATLTTSTLPLGNYTVVATYQGDVNDAGSTASEPLSVIIATTQTTVTASPNPALVGQTITFQASVSGNGGTPTGTVNFLANGKVIGAAALNGGTATFTDSSLAAGTYTITASYSGDAADSPSVSGSISETIGLIPTETNLGTSTTSGATPQVMLVATVLNGATGPMPTGTVSFIAGGKTLGSASVSSNGVATLVPNLTAGASYSITATYSGDIAHKPSSSQPVTISGTATDFEVTVTPPAVTMKTTQNATVTVNLSSFGGFSDSIGLGCASLPPGVNCHFSSIDVNLPANGTATAQLTIDTNNPLSGGTSTTNAAHKAGPRMAGLFLPFSLFFGWLFWRMRRRNASLWSLVLLLTLSAGALFATGCSGFSMGSAKPGTYTIQIVGTGTNSNVVHYQNETVTITQ
ncbi:MAG: Ig-like domain repeat protein [Acidobacteriota bacterium]